MKAVLYLLAIATVLTGLLGILGEFSYLTGDRANPERYQFMHLAAVPPLLFSPGLILFGAIYWWQKSRLSRIDAILLNASVVPLLLSLVGLFAISILD